VRRHLLGWGPPLLLAAVIFYISSRSTVPAPEFPGADKMGHFVIYAVLGWLLARAAVLTGISLWWAVAFGVLYGATDEIHQAYVPGRSSEFLDWVADSAGVATAVYLYHRWHARARGRSRRPAAPPVRDPAGGTHA
jgi:VanZ family protein